MKMSLEKAQEINNTSIWKDIVGEIDFRIESCLEKLKSCPEQDLGELQTRIRILESVKNLPDDVIDREETVDGIIGPYREIGS